MLFLVVKYLTDALYFDFISPSEMWDDWVSLCHSFSFLTASVFLYQVCGCNDTIFLSEILVLIETEFCT